MATLDQDQINNIILKNPNKDVITKAQQESQLLMLNVLGRGMGSALTKADYFESDDIFNCRNKDAVSNKDVFARVLQREEMIFTAKGGASYYKGLSPQETIQFDAILDKVRFGMTIRKWVKEFALKAYRVDPMSVLFVEVDTTGKSAYPTYKSIDCIYDYQTNGRKLEYVCFRLTPKDISQFLGTTPVDVSTLPVQKYTTNYFRLIDDAYDRIVKKEANSVTELSSMAIVFDQVPAIVSSDIISFDDTKCFLSPLDSTMELAKTYMVDRSIRDLSKKYSGFPKGYEPLLQCSTCSGTGLLGAVACPDCSQVGAAKGTGKKLRTKVSDIARFPFPKEGQTGGISDPSKYFGYITPDIATWDKQDTSLNDIENLMQDVYWGTVNRQSTTGPTVGAKDAFQETATKTLADLQPIYTRLNQTADWAESTENALCNFIGEYNFASFQKSARTYGRYYILETPDELIEQYLDQKTKGAPQTVLFDTLRKYYHSVYANDPMQIAIKVKLVDVEPFIHQTVAQVLVINPSMIDYLSKVYYSEWLATKEDLYLLVTPKEELIADLYDFAKAKQVLPAELAAPPTVAVGENIRNTN